MMRTRCCWFIVFLLFAITGVNYVDCAAIAHAIPAMHRDLSLSPTNTGAILGGFADGFLLMTTLALPRCWL